MCPLQKTWTYCGEMFHKIPTAETTKQSTPNNSNEGANAGGKRVCKFCEKEGHTADKYFVLEKAEKKIKSEKSKVNEVQEGHEQSTSKN